MQLDDIGDYPHAERTRHFLTNTVPTRADGTFDPSKLTYDALLAAQNDATAEMLDEIHCMLRHLLQLKT